MIATGRFCYYCDGSVRTHDRRARYDWIGNYVAHLRCSRAYYRRWATFWQARGAVVGKVR